LRGLDGRTVAGSRPGVGTSEISEHGFAEIRDRRERRNSEITAELRFGIADSGRAYPAERCAEIALVARDGGERRLRPAVQLAVRAIRVLIRDRFGDVDEHLGAFAERGEALPPLPGSLRNREEKPLDVVERRLELAPGDGPSAAAGARSRERLLRERKAVGDPFEGARIEGRSVQPFETGVLKGDQVPGEVPAVDGRDVTRLERREGARVVPVVEVTAILLQSLDRPERR